MTAKKKDRRQSEGRNASSTELAGVKGAKGRKELRLSGVQQLVRHDPPPVSWHTNPGRSAGLTRTQG
jgi:hypothetical protein